MSKLRMGLAVLGILVLLLPGVRSGTAEARGLRIAIGGPIGIVGFAASRMLGLRGLHGRHYAGRSDHGRSINPNETTAGSPARMDMAGGPDWVTRPVARVQLAAMTALAAWHGGRSQTGWWRHQDGGYGWVGSLFWPFAYYDVYDYAVWGDGMGFWGYGYRDIYAAMFTPFASDELTRLAEPPRGRRQARLPSLAKLCGDDADEAATLPTDQIRQPLRLISEQQRGALDDLANASIEAAQLVRAACPTDVPWTAPGRLAAMQQRLEAMKSAIARIRTPFETFYELLDDEQKGNLARSAEQRAQFAPKIPAAQSCTPPETLPWPGREIEKALHLNDAQREALGALQRMNALAMNTLNFDCQPDEQLAPPDRLATADTRLDAMLDALKLVRPALDDFIATLSDEQKAQFEAIGPRRTS